MSTNILGNISYYKMMTNDDKCCSRIKKSGLQLIFYNNSSLLTTQN